RRSTVASGGFGRAEILSVTGLTRSRTPVVHSPRFQVLFPLAGVFRWHVGSRAPLVDPNQVLFIAAGDESRDSHPSVREHEPLPPARVVRLPRRSPLAPLGPEPAPLHRRGCRTPRQPPGRRRCRGAPPPPRASPARIGVAL